MEIKDVVMKLIGNLHPVGETNADEKSFKNLQTLTNLTDHLLDNIFDVYKYNSHSLESSVQKASNHSKQYLCDVVAEYDDIRSPI